MIALVAMTVLAIRAMVRLELRWDTFSYHLPSAAKLAGIPLPYEMNGVMEGVYEGFPPLAHFLQGLFWRLSGTVNATGVVGYLAFCLFLAFCHFKLRAPWWLVTLICLSAPMVLIHATTSYIDLFGNSLLAIGVASFLFALLLPERAELRLLVFGVLGLVGAAWSKPQLTPLTALFFCLLAMVYLGFPANPNGGRKRALAVLVGASVLAALPYIKNLIVYRNPLWPNLVPGAGTLFRYSFDGGGVGALLHTPPELVGSPGYMLFFRSLFEINHPTQYPNRPRWIIDQGNTSTVAFRSGGFWYVGVLVFLALLVFMAFRLSRRQGFLASISFAGLLGVLAVIPFSLHLRYFLFLPLSWAAGIGILFPDFRARFPRAAVGIVSICLSLFLYMAWVNRVHYRIEKIGYREAATVWGANSYWPLLRTGQTYCAVGMEPMEVLLTGPTMSEYRIVSAPIEELCPANAFVITRGGIRQPWARATAPAGVFSEKVAARRSRAEDAVSMAQAAPFLAESSTHLAAGRYLLATEAATNALEINPFSAIAYTTICAARNALGQPQDAIRVCERALEIDPRYELARMHLAEAWAHIAEPGRSKIAELSPAAELANSVRAFYAKEFAGSIEAAARALRGDPRLAEAYNNICAASAALGRGEDAVHACTLALEIKPDFQLAKNNLAWALTVRSQPPTLSPGSTTTPEPRH